MYLIYTGYYTGNRTIRVYCDETQLDIFHFKCKQCTYQYELIRSMYGNTMQKELCEKTNRVPVDAVNFPCYTVQRTTLVGKYLFN